MNNNNKSIHLIYIEPEEMQLQMLHMKRKLFHVTEKHFKSISIYTVQKDKVGS